jgi:hypothetical protein
LGYYGIENVGDSFEATTSNANTTQITLIQLLIDLRGRMPLYIKTLTRGIITVECVDRDTIEEIKRKILSVQQRLMYGGQQLEGKLNMWCARQNGM